MGTGFLRRLGWYLVGLSMGILFLVFFVRKKAGEKGIEFCYFPNCRVLKDLRTKPITYAEGLENRFSQDSLLWHSFFTDGDVDFGQSDTKVTPCAFYQIANAQGRVLHLQNCAEEVLVLSVE
ncbi:MAG: DUF4258 domain-containing protein [Bacteroidota bacterium]